MDHVDVIVVGAGISGIGAGYHLQDKCPDRSYMILEGRADMGGTWDLFRYPGIRSDSDMYTLGYIFEPWTEAKAIADGPNILNYVKRTAAKYGIDRHIRFGHHVTDASWSTEQACWTVTAVSEGREVQYSCHFLFMCSGYYNYAKGHRPEFAGEAEFAGRIIHPQFWPDDLDYLGKRVVVIGSGATAVTIVPEMAKTAAKVTMLQRSPTYVVSRPSEDAGAMCCSGCISLTPRVSIQSRRRSACWECWPSICPRPSSPNISRRAIMSGTSGYAWCPIPTCSTRSMRAKPMS